MPSIDPAIQQRIDHWLNGPYDEETKAIIRKKLDHEQYDELSDAFYKDLAFGTGGIRGIMGVGPNRINKYTLGKATQGLSNELNQQYAGGDLKVVIAHDCRNHGKEFAHVVSNVFSANGISVYLFEELRPTPELSFAIRELGCHGGVMLTASHNPKEYNGYKVYGPDGGQLVSPRADNVMKEVQKIETIDDVNFDGDNQLITKLTDEIDEKYLQAVEKVSVSPDAIQRQHDLSIVYSPLHGTGGVMVPPALARLGFDNLTLVKEQMTYDGDFPSVEKPNPEEPEAMTLALQKARDINAELVMATDPDADRVGIAVKNTDDEWVLLNGNQTGSLIIHYMLEAWKQANKLNDDPYIIKTIVTSYLLDRIAESYEVDCYNTLTGFKYIGEMITKLEGKKQFIAGGEESYGYLIGDHVRDKDAVVSATVIAEMAAYYKDRGNSLFDALLEIYEEFGYFREKLESIYKRGRQGAEEIEQMMQDYRKNPPKTLGGSQVVKIKDFQSRTSSNMETGDESNIDLPASNVLQFVMEDGSRVSVRPSGTEPKIKFYCSVHAGLENRDDFEAITQQLEKKMDSIIDELAK